MTAKRIGIVLSLLLIVAASFVLRDLPAVAGADTQPTTRLVAEAEVATLLQQRAANASVLVAATQAVWETGGVPVADLIAAHEELVDAELQLAGTDAERLDALQKYFKNAKAVDDRIEPLYKSGVVGGEAHFFTSARAARLRAEIALKRELLRQMSK